MSLKCWGDNSTGQLGLDRQTICVGDEPGEMGTFLPAVDLGTDAEPVGVAVGAYHACALLSDGRVKCWGHNEVGQLGYGDTEGRGDGCVGSVCPEGYREMGDLLPAVPLGPEAPVQIAAGAVHSCVRFVDGTLKCWGGNSYGQLGLGHSDDMGDDPGELEALALVELGAPAIWVTAGQAHTCALLEGGQLKCWGKNSSGRLGLGDGQARGTTPDSMADLPAIDLGPPSLAVGIAAGALHTCALLPGGDVKCWGNNSSGQLGLGDLETRGLSQTDMGEFLPTVNLGSGTVERILTADDRSCVEFSSTSGFKCWGNNLRGELGQDDHVDRGTTPGSMGAALRPPVVGERPLAVAMGSNHTCAITATHRLKCWGDNSAGQLGLGDREIRGDGCTGETVETRNCYQSNIEMGTFLPYINLGASP